MTPTSMRNPSLSLVVDALLSPRSRSSKARFWNLRVVIFYYINYKHESRSRMYRNVLFRYLSLFLWIGLFPFQLLWIFSEISHSAAPTHEQGSNGNLKKFRDKIEAFRTCSIYLQDTSIKAVGDASSGHLRIFLLRMLREAPNHWNLTK